ncbi:hypothetical protein LIER_30665 [Lithospermum erythrorhizon]|uniref:ATP-dependent DNA helicase n=1 Tax=Lithospermum erythrorhizon TaxID=34254 RepID=A0AAV3RQR2_LITER
MAEDFIRVQTQLHLSNEEFHLVPFEYITTEFERLTREISAERSIPVPEEDLLAIHRLNIEQKAAFDLIYDAALSGKGGVYFVDGPGGTGKSFLYKVLLAHIRSKGYIGLIVASSGIAASNFLGGRTAHSRFKIPIDGGPNVKSLLSFQSSEAELIRTSKIIIWDEAPMADKSIIEALNNLLQELCENKLIFGGRLVVFGGDFRQVLPVVPRGTRKEQVEASVVTCTLWNHFIKLRLTDNMRARDDPGFINFLMRIGNGEEPTNDNGKIAIPRPMLIPYTSVEQSLELLIAYVYPQMEMFQSDPFEMMKRTILCPKNEFVDDINHRLIDRLQGNQVVNINPVEGLCNGTRLICKILLPNVVGAIIAIGQFRGKHVSIPKIPLEPNPSDSKYLIPFIRRQIPVRLCFAITINKSQGQTLDYVGLYLKQPVFSHGQLYVGLSRAKSGKNVKVLIIPPTCSDPGTEYTTNVVYNEVLTKANLS